MDSGDGGSMRAIGFRYFADLWSHENEWGDNRLFDLEAVHGITDLTVTSSVKGYKCPHTYVTFYGTIYEQIHSNAGSFASTAEDSDTYIKDDVLHENAWNPVGVSVYWTHSKVTHTNGPFYIGYTVHYWSPPGGNYDSYGIARMQMSNGYKFGMARLCTLARAIVRTRAQIPTAGTRGTDGRWRGARRSGWWLIAFWALTVPAVLVYLGLRWQDWRATRAKTLE